MPDTDIAALQAVLDEICADVPASETATRERVAAKLREAARGDRCSLEDLRRVGRDALIRAPTMWLRAFRPTKGPALAGPSFSRGALLGVALGHALVGASALAGRVRALGGLGVGAGGLRR